MTIGDTDRFHFFHVSLPVGMHKALKLWLDVLEVRRGCFLRLTMGGRYQSTSVVVRDLQFKDKHKDLKLEDKDKDLWFEDEDKDKDL